MSIYNISSMYVIHCNNMNVVLNIVYTLLIRLLLLLLSKQLVFKMVDIKVQLGLSERVWLSSASPTRSTCWARGRSLSAGWAPLDARWSSSSWVTWPGWPGRWRRRGLTWASSCGTTCSEGWATTRSKVRGQSTHEGGRREVPQEVQCVEPSWVMHVYDASR